MENNFNGMTEQEIMNDALATEKQLISVYGTYISEASCQNLRNELNKIITETQQVQFEIFNAMKAKGWYNVKNAQMGDVQQTCQKYQQVKSQL
jgi:spore coat protein CotF